MVEKNFTSLYFDTNIDIYTSYRKITDETHISDEDEISEWITKISPNFILKGYPVIEAKGRIKYSSNIFYDTIGHVYSAKESGYAYNFRDQILLLPCLHINEQKTLVRAIIPSVAHVRKTFPIYLLRKELRETNVDLPRFEERSTRIEHFFQGKGGMVTLNEARAAVTSKNGKVSLLNEAIEKNVLIDNHFLTYEAIRTLVPVSKNEILGTYTPFVKEQDGEDVFGKTIAATGRYYRDEELAGYSKGIKVDEDTAQVYATEDGFLKFLQGGLPSVSPTSVFHGDVKEYVASEEDLFIKGSLLRNAFVSCKGNVTISGIIDGAKLYVEGNVIVEGGIMNGAYVQAFKGIEAQFISASEIIVDGSLRIRKYILNSTIYATTFINVYDPEKGRIMGSSVHAGTYIKVAIGGGDQNRRSFFEILRFPKRSFAKVRLSHMHTQMDFVHKQIDKLKKSYGTKYIDNDNKLSQFSVKQVERFEQARSHFKKLQTLLTELKKLEKNLTEVLKKPEASKSSYYQKNIPSVFFTFRILPEIRLFMHGRHIDIQHAIGASKYYLEAKQKKIVREDYTD